MKFFQKIKNFFSRKKKVIVKTNNKNPSLVIKAGKNVVALSGEAVSEVADELVFLDLIDNGSLDGSVFDGLGEAISSIGEALGNAGEAVGDAISSISDSFDD